MILENIKEQQALKLTENGAVAETTTRDYLLDLFSLVGGFRNNPYDTERLFIKALATDKLNAVRLAFHTRDIRGGMGERRCGRVMFQYLATYYPKIFIKNIDLIAKYGRYDDLMAVYIKADVTVQKAIIKLIKNQLNEDINNYKQKEGISLLAKWLPSINASSYKTRALAQILVKKLKMTNKEYRKTLSMLRTHLDITEKHLSEKDINAIDYSKVPSLAMSKYFNTFYNKDKKRYTKYIDDVLKGKETINASVLYPYNIIEPILYGYKSTPKVWEAQWKALPNFVEGDENILVMADVSGSMAGRPMATSIGLAMYFAERNKGAFHNHFMTFSSNPTLEEIVGNNILEKLKSLSKAHWEMTTDLDKAFKLILNTAIEYNTPKEEMPKAIIVISDMEIDCCTEKGTFSDYIEQEYNDNGYKLPKLIFWNVNTRNNTFLSNKDGKALLVSGSSTTTFKTLIEGINKTPLEYMYDVLATYSDVRV